MQANFQEKLLLNEYISKSYLFKNILLIKILEPASDNRVGIRTITRLKWENPKDQMTQEKKWNGGKARRDQSLWRGKWVSFATRKADRSLGEEKRVMTCAELQGWARCFHCSKMLKTRLYMKL